MSGEWYRCGGKSNCAYPNRARNLTIGESNAQWLSDRLNIKRGGDGITLANENTIRACVGSGGWRLNFNIYIGATGISAEVEENMF